MRRHYVHVRGYISLKAMIPTKDVYFDDVLNKVMPCSGICEPPNIYPRCSVDCSTMIPTKDVYFDDVLNKVMPCSGICEPPNIYPRCSVDCSNYVPTVMTTTTMSTTTTVTIPTTTALYEDEYSRSNVIYWLLAVITALLVMVILYCTFRNYRVLLERAKRMFCKHLKLSVEATGAEPAYDSSARGCNEAAASGTPEESAPLMTSRGLQPMRIASDDATHGTRRTPVDLDTNHDAHLSISSGQPTGDNLSPSQHTLPGPVLPTTYNRHPDGERIPSANASHGSAENSDSDAESNVESDTTALMNERTAINTTQSELQTPDQIFSGTTSVLSDQSQTGMEARDTCDDPQTGRKHHDTSLNARANTLIAQMDTRMDDENGIRAANGVNKEHHDGQGDTHIKKVVVEIRLNNDSHTAYEASAN